MFVGKGNYAIQIQIHFPVTFTAAIFFPVNNFYQLITNIYSNITSVCSSGPTHKYFLDDQAHIIYILIYTNHFNVHIRHLRLTLGDKSYCHV
jgi:hypothetical protein